MVALINECLTNNDAVNKILLAADIVPLSTPELVKLLAKNFSKNIFLFKLPFNILDIFLKMPILKKYLSRLTDSLEVDSQESLDLINFELPFSTKTGLKKTSLWFKNHF